MRRALLLGLLAACDGGLLRGDAGPIVEDGGAGDGGGLGVTCPVVGDWRLSSIRCGAQDITADYQARVTSTTLGVTASETGCQVTLTLSSDPFCAETEVFSAEPMVSSWSVTSDGITTCLFEGCNFGFEDDPCVIGDHAGRRTENLTFGFDSFTTARFGAGTFCAASIAQIVTWVRQ